MDHAPFVHLRVRSAFSLLEGAVRTEELVARCKAERMPAVAVTDTGHLYNVMPFCAQAKGVGVQPIVGALMPLALEVAKRTSGGPPRQPPQVLLLVQNETGYRNLLKLMSAAYLDREREISDVLTLDDLAAHHDGLILLTGGPGGPIGVALARGDAKAARAMLASLKGIFEDRLYVELMRHGLTVETATEAGTIDIADEAGVRLVATNDIHFMDEAMYAAHDALVCIADGTQLADPDRRRVTLDHRFKTPAEMTALFDDLPDAVANTLVVARRCSYIAPARDPILPPFESASGRNEADELRTQAREGLERRLVRHVFTEGMDDATRAAEGARYRERLAFELDVVVSMEFPGYFLIVADFINWAKAQDIPVGPGRGSGAGSVVSWSLGITDLDPLRFGLLFERFLNPERVSMPDFDIDFCQNQRDRVIEYVRARYGAARVAQIGTFGKLQSRAVLRDVGRVLGLPYGLVDRICKLVPQNPANPPTLEMALAMEPRLADERARDPQIARLIDIGLKLEGLPRHVSTHAAGVVIGDRPLDELVPLQRDPRSGVAVTQFNMKDVEKAGLVKFDFLGLTTLTMLRMGETMVNQRGTKLVLADLTLDDPKSYELLSRADAAGVFQLESPGMRDALRKLRPDCFDDIVALVSLYRPGPMENIPVYSNVKHGVEKANYLHPELESILKETNGVIIYQEQVMQIARDLAGYSLASADLLRRAMGKKIKEEMDAQRDIFVDGAVAHGIEPRLAATIFELLAKFASYGFNKSHAAAYAVLTYQTAYLKANHPVEFFAASMTMELADHDKLGAYRQALRERGIPLYPPDVNHSAPLFSVEDGTEGTGVRFALAAIKGVGQQAMEALCAERERGGPFQDLFDLVGRVGGRVLNKRLLEGLARAGALDGLCPNRAQIVAGLDLVMRHGASAQAETEAGQDSLFGALSEQRPASRPSLPAAAQWPALAALKLEHEALGFYLTAHPLDGFRAALERLGVIDASAIREHVVTTNASRVSLAGVVVAKRERVTERSRFAHVQLSDASAHFEVTVFAELLAQHRELLEPGTLIQVDAEVRIDGDAVRLTGMRIEPLDDSFDEEASMVEIRVRSLDVALALRSTLSTTEPTGARVRLVVPTGSGDEMILDLDDSFRVMHTRRLDVQRHAGVVEVRDL